MRPFVSVERDVEGASRHLGMRRGRTTARAGWLAISMHVVLTTAARPPPQHALGRRRRVRTLPQLVHPGFD